MNNLIMIVEDESDILELVSLNLKKAGFNVNGFPEGESFLKKIEEKTPALVILDLMLPDMDGMEICKKLRRKPKFESLPIIMLTAKGDEMDKIIGLELGADDYISKPFSPRELVARVKAVLRRNLPMPSKNESILIDDVLAIDPLRFEVRVKGKKIDLTQAEFKILRLLASNAGRVYSRQEILDNLWGDEKVVIDRTVDVHIRHLREKLGKLSSAIKNIRGVGYKFEK